MTLDTARLVANVNHRAQRLYEDGYHAVWVEEPYELDMTNEEGTTYRLNVLFDYCTCPYWIKHRETRKCKHLLGWKRLLERQAEAKRRGVPDREPVREPVLEPAEVTP